MRVWFREPFSGISHLVGVLLSVVGLTVLLYLAQGKPWHILSFAIFGASLILLYSASTLYHSLPITGKLLSGWQRLDHSAIFLLIAGTYAPVCLVLLRGTYGWSLLIAEYLLAVVGIVSLLLFKSKPDWLRVVFYMSMGWIALLALPALRFLLSPAALAWLIGGGVLYTVGTVFYATNWPRLWPGKFSAHDLWHLFVLGGNTCHFVLMLYIVPIA